MSSSPSYKQFLHFQVPLQEIVSATDSFSDANLIRESALRKAYKGQVLLSQQQIDIVAEKFDRTFRQADATFVKEISILSSLKHKNLVSFVGFCDGNGERIIIYKHEVNGSLDQFLRDPKLTWMKRLHICVGVGRALSYIYYDKHRDSSIIHGDITSSKIFLDEKWDAKLSGFEFSMTQTAARRNFLCLANVSGTLGYCDPMDIKSGSVTHKSDVYSFGVLLFEVLCGKRAHDVMAQEANRLLAPLAKDHYEGGRLDDIIDPDLRKQMDPQSIKMFSETAYFCLKEHRSERPNIDQIVLKLQEALETQWKHENPRAVKLLKHLEIPLTDIVSATENFDRKNILGQGSYGEVYKANLFHFDDSKDIFSLEEINEDELLKKYSTVAIKRIFKREDKQDEQGFLTEIEILSRCKHANVVSLLGFCKGPHDMILVYEHVPNKSLDHYLENPDNFAKITWVQRIKICIDIARGLNYLHTEKKDKRRIIHRDIKSANILLGDNWVAKIADFGLSKFYPENQQVTTFYTQHNAGTQVYMDPEYEKTGKLQTGTDIYSFGVVLFEILSGRLAYDALYTTEHSRGIAPVARRCFNDRTMEQMVDYRLKEEIHENIFILTKGPHQSSLYAFLEIAYQCVAETQASRPTTEIIIKKLEEALDLQQNNFRDFEIPLSDILLATGNFDLRYFTESDSHSETYNAEVEHFDRKRFLSLEETSKGKRLMKRRSMATIKRIRKNVVTQEEPRFVTDMKMLCSCNHPNIRSLIGFCAEDNYTIIVYEHASNRALDNYLGNINLTWLQRIKIGIDIARGLDYLHSGIEGERTIIHRSIISSNILLAGNWEAKIAGFEFAVFLSKNEQENAMYVQDIVGTPTSLDPEYDATGRLNHKTDIYSLGVVLLEIMSGRPAYDKIYTMEDTNGIAPVARRRFNEGTIKEMLDPVLLEETHENVFPLRKGPHQDSLDAFIKIAYQCVAETQDERPTARVVIEKLEEALSFQENPKDSLKFSLEEIELFTQNYADNNLIGRGRFGRLYKGEVAHANGRDIVAAKRLNKSLGQGKDEFLTELQILLEYKHENIIELVGYCTEMDEKIIVYEYMSQGSLDKHLSNNGLTWIKRLEICIDIASGLNFLHGVGGTQEVVIHRDIKTINVLLNDAWKAKIANFDLSMVSPIDNHMDFVFDNNVGGTTGSYDPLYDELGLSTKESDICSFGVILFEILCGRLLLDHNFDDGHPSLSLLAKHNFNEGNIDEMVFEGIREQIAPQSLTMFQMIACQCLHPEREQRPTICEVLLQLKKALEIQVAMENEIK